MPPAERKDNNWRQVSDKKMAQVLKLNIKLARHLSFMYHYPDKEELESAGLEGIAQACKIVRRTRRQGKWSQLCNICIRARMIDHIRDTAIQNAAIVRAARVYAIHTITILEEEPGED